MASEFQDQLIGKLGELTGIAPPNGVQPKVRFDRIASLLFIVRQPVRCVVLKLLGKDRFAVHASAFRVLRLVTV
jgi:hypothetical protein